MYLLIAYLSLVQALWSRLISSSLFCSWDSGGSLKLIMNGVSHWEARSVSRTQTKMSASVAFQSSAHARKTLGEITRESKPWQRKWKKTIFPEFSIFLILALYLWHLKMNPNNGSHLYKLPQKHLEKYHELYIFLFCCNHRNTVHSIPITLVILVDAQKRRTVDITLHNTALQIGKHFS